MVAMNERLNALKIMYLAGSKSGRHFSKSLALTYLIMNAKETKFTLSITKGVSSVERPITTVIKSMRLNEG